MLRLVKLLNLGLWLVSLDRVLFLNIRSIRMQNTNMLYATFAEMSKL